MQNEIQQPQGETKRCPKCGESIQSSAKKCKHCQADLRNWFMRHKIITGFGGIFLFFAFMVAISGESDTVTKNLDEVSKNVDATSKKMQEDLIKGATKQAEKITTKETKKKEEKVEYIKVTADDLCDEYKSNEIAADKKFKDKYLEITGIIKAIDSDFSDNAVVRLKCGGEYSLDNVSCSFSSNDEAATLKKGSKVTVLGKSTGEVIGSPMLKNCKIK